MYYVDDFLLIVPDGGDPHAAAAAFDAVCIELGLTVAHDKDEGPTRRLVFTGTGIDTEAMTVFIPDDRKDELIRLTSEAAQRITTKGFITYKRAATLAGKMMFACRAMPSAKPFGWQLMQLVGAGKKRVPYSVALERDLTWWCTHLPTWSGSSVLNISEWVTSSDVNLETDASLFGWGVASGTRWLRGKWSRDEREQATRRTRESMPWMELYAIVRAAK